MHRVRGAEVVLFESDREDSENHSQSEGEEEDSQRSPVETNMAEGNGNNLSKMVMDYDTLNLNDLHYVRKDVRVERELTVKPDKPYTKSIIDGSIRDAEVPPRAPCHFIRNPQATLQQKVARLNCDMAQLLHFTRAMGASLANQYDLDTTGWELDEQDEDDEDQDDEDDEDQDDERVLTLKPGTPCTKSTTDGFVREADVPPRAPCHFIRDLQATPQQMVAQLNREMAQLLHYTRAMYASLAIQFEFDTSRWKWEEQDEDDEDQDDEEDEDQDDENKPYSKSTIDSFVREAEVPSRGPSCFLRNPQASLLQKLSQFKRQMAQLKHYTRAMGASLANRFDLDRSGWELEEQDEDNEDQDDEEEGEAEDHYID